MTDYPSKPVPIQVQDIVNVVGNIQRLTVKAFNAQNLQNLIFIILNDTYQVFKYDRAILFSKNAGKVSVLGISGQTTFNLQTEMASRLREAIQNLSDSSRQRVLNAGDFTAYPQHWDYIQSQRQSTVYWFPFQVGKEEVGLWLERYDDPEAKKAFETHGSLIKESLLPAYAAAWKKMNPRFSLYKILPHISLKRAGIFLLGLLILLLLIPIRLRVVAPAEVVPKDPYIVTAPMEGIIDHVAVVPGEVVQKKQLLFQYDNKIPQYKYEAALKDVDLLKSDLNRSYVAGTGNQSEMSKLGVLDLQLKSGERTLAFAQEQLGFLANYSPLEGTVSMDSPDEWRGRPVQMGEKVMTISDPYQSKLKIWIPITDAMEFDPDVPLKVFFNPLPEKTFEAKLSYITPEVKISDQLVPSLQGEAEWLQEEHPKLGLKGYAFIYGEKVSLFYYLLRKPIHFIQKLLD